MPEGKERGFTQYYYDTSEPSGYCILDKEGKYERQRIYLGITIGCLLAFIAICVPLIFYMIFNKFHEVMKQPQNNEKKNNWRYFTWGTVATCCFLSLIISIYDIYVFASNIRYYPRHSNGKESHYMYRIYVFFCVVISLMILCFIFDAVLISLSLCLIKKANSGDKCIKDIEIPVWFQKVLKILPCCCCCCGETDMPAVHRPQEPEQNRPCNCNKTICAQSVALWFGNFMVTAFLQLIGFHVFFMGLGVLATPVPSLSMICFFVSFFVLSIVFFAMLLKITNTENYCIFFFSFILAVLGLSSFISLVLYYYSYFLAVEDYNYDSVILTLLGHILPVAVSGFLIFCGQRLVQYVKEGGFAGGQPQDV